MPDALSILLGMNSPSNANLSAKTLNGTYEPNIDRNVRADLLMKYLGLQEDPTDVTPQTELEGAYQQQVAEQRAAEQAKAEAAVYPERVKGEYALRQEQLKGQYGLQTELEKAKQAEAQRLQQQTFTHGENEARNAAVSGRQEKTIAGQNLRSGNYQAGMAARQGIAQREARAKNLLAGKEQPEYPPTNGLMDNLKYYLGIGPYDRTTAAQKQAADLRAQNVGAVANPAAGLSFEEFAAQTIQKVPDATPEEIQQWFNELNGVQ